MGQRRGVSAAARAGHENQQPSGATTPVLGQQRHALPHDLDHGLQQTQRQPSPGLVSGLLQPLVSSHFISGKATESQSESIWQALFAKAALS